LVPMHNIFPLDKHGHSHFMGYKSKMIVAVGIIKIVV
jgi:hypothetical protein